MQDISPKFNVLTAEQEIVIPPSLSDSLGQTIGGLKANAQELVQGKVKIQGVSERILIGDATAPMTGVGIFMGSDQAATVGYDFRVGDPGGDYLHWDASAGTLTISGTAEIVAGATIAGFDIGTDYIRDAANSMGLASTITGGDDVRFWAGATFANRATAPFRVTEAGVVTGSNFSITGGSISGTTTVGIANVNLASRGWVQTCVFSVTDADTVAWTSGTFTSADGTSYSIGAGNTGNMANKTYIYLDIGTSTVAYQTTTTASTAAGSGKVIVAIAQNGTNEATYTTMNDKQRNIDASDIVASSITANEIAASTITAGKMSVTSLSSITSNLGDITAGTIVLPSGGYIRSGQTAYDTGTGWYIGNDSGTSKFSIGNSSASKLTWDGTNFANTGIFDVVKLYTAGTDLTAGDAVFLASDGSVYKASADISVWADGFIGFVKTTTSKGNSAPIVIAGEAAGFSSLTTGSRYYVAGHTTSVSISHTVAINNISMINTSEVGYQSFTVGGSDIIMTGAKFDFSAITGSPEITIRIRTGTGVGGTLLASGGATLTISHDLFTLDRPIQLSANTVYSVTFQWNGVGSFQQRGDTANGYAGGRAQSDPGHDIYFEIYKSSNLGAVTATPTSYKCGKATSATNMLITHTW